MDPPRHSRRCSEPAEPTPRAGQRWRGRGGARPRRRRAGVRGARRSERAGQGGSAAATVGGAGVGAGAAGQGGGGEGGGGGESVVEGHDPVGVDVKMASALCVIGMVHGPQGTCITGKEKGA